MTRVVTLLVLSVATVSAQPVPHYVGASTCVGCHSEQFEEWQGARHSKMLQPASAGSVKGDFSRGQITLKGVNYTLRAERGAYFIASRGQEYRVSYTLGSRRIQHYLTKLGDGRLVVLPPSWDVLRKEWFHNMDIVDPEEADSGVAQVWNKNCYSCHVSREEKKFNAAANTYETAWQDFGTNCERCHGPASEHVATREAGAARPAKLIVPSKLDATRSSMVCAQCHSAREIVADGFKPGENYLDYFLPILEYGQKPGKDPAYWVDGRPRRFSNDTLGLWQSQCYLQGGATCTNCHTDVHDPEIEKNTALRPGANAICTQCHADVARNLSAHTHHPADSAGSACVECHMPRTVFSIRAAIRDHTISIPVPDNTARYGIPNACNVCHKDREPQWAVAKMNEWYGSTSRQPLMLRASAFTQARAGNASAVPMLLSILNDPKGSSVARANAAGYLGRFSNDAKALAGLTRALSDPEPLVRAVAAQRIDPNSPVVASALIASLRDPVRSVRLGALISLLSRSDTAIFPQEELPVLESVKQEYLAREAILSDDAGEQRNVGVLHLMSGNPAAAAAAFETSLKLDARMPVRVLLARAYYEAGRRADSTRVLRDVPQKDPEFAAAQRLLQALRD